MSDGDRTRSGSSKASSTGELIVGKDRHPRPLDSTPDATNSGIKAPANHRARSGPPTFLLCQVLNARITPSLGETDHVEHAPAVLVRQEPVRARRDVFERLVALGNGGLNLERTEVYAHPAQGLEGRPRPLVGSLGDHIFVSERPAALRARGHELEGVLFRKIVGAGKQDVVADLALGVRLLELRVPLGEAVSASASWAPNAPYTGSQTDTTVSSNKSSSRNGGSTSKGGIVSLNAAPTTRPCPSRMARDCTSVSSLTSMASPELVGSVRAVRRTIQYICVSVSHEPNESVPKGSVWRTSMSPAGGCLGGRR